MVKGTRPAVNFYDGGPQLLRVVCGRPRGGAGRDDVGVVADRLVAVEVAEAVLADFGAARGVGRAGVYVGAVVVGAERRPVVLVGAAPFDEDAGEAALEEVDGDLAIGQRDGLAGRLGRRGGGARAAAFGRDDAEFEAERGVVGGGGREHWMSWRRRGTMPGATSAGGGPRAGVGGERAALLAERAVFYQRSCRPSAIGGRPCRSAALRRPRS